MKRKFTLIKIIVLILIIFLALLISLYLISNKSDKKEIKPEKNIDIEIQNDNKQKEESPYIGYYADVNADGEVDGVIYADLAFEKSGNYDGIYSYSKETNLKEYIISEENSKTKTFGINKVVTLKKESIGKERFYVMALEDFRTGSFEAGSGSTEGTYYWYYDEWSHTRPKITSEDFGTGEDNTKNMIKIWNASGTKSGYTDSSQNDKDMWKHIQTKNKEGWFIPSINEWRAFADFLSNKKENKITTENYNSLYGLSDAYWSSSRANMDSAWYIYFKYGDTKTDYVSANFSVRLSIKF